MSTELKSRSRGYNLTRVAMKGIGNVGLAIGTGYNKPAITLGMDEIKMMFVSRDFSRLNDLGLLDETINLLKLDIYAFSMTKGHGMEAE